MWGRGTFDRAQLVIALWGRAVEFSEFRCDHKLSNGAGLMPVASFCDELWVRRSSSCETRFLRKLRILENVCYIASVAIRTPYFHRERCADAQC